MHIITKTTRAQRKALDTIDEARYKAANPEPKKIARVYGDMQNHINKRIEETPELRRKFKTW